MDQAIPNVEFVDFSHLVETIQPGETVLIEHRTSYVPEFTLKLVADYTKENGVPLVIDDNFDTLYTLILHLRLMGVEVDLDHAYVIKTGGGTHNIGGKVKRIEFHPDPRVYLRNYINASAEILVEGKTPAINLVLGLENILMIMRDSRDFYRLLLSLQRYVGNKNRIALYLINRNIVESMMPGFFLPELERIATTVIETNSYPPTGAILTFKKSINPAVIGTTVGIDVGGSLVENETRTHDYSRIPFFQGENLKPGSLVLIENISSPPGAKLSFYALLKVSKEKGIPLIVEDIFDTLPIYVKHIELMGFYVPSESINVIKVAGIDSVGNVVEKLSFEADPNFYIPKKERAVSKIVGDNTPPHILLILGLERLLMFQRNLRDLYPIVRYFRENLNSPPNRPR